MSSTEVPPTQASPADRPTAPSGPDFLAMAASPEFRELRRRLRRFVFPLTAFFLVWYGAYVALGAFAHDVMATKVWGNVNVGLLVGLGQFLTTFLITAAYVWFANRELDPRAAAIRDRLEGPAS